MRKGTDYWRRNMPLARFLSVILSISMVLSLMPAQGIAEAREEFFSGSIGRVEGGGSNSNNTAMEDPGEGGSTANTVGTVQSGNDTGSPGGQGTQSQTDGETQESQSTAEEAAQTKEVKYVETINELVTNASLEDVASTDAAIVVDEGKEYIAKLTFAEKADVQFANGKELVFTLPQGFTPSVIQPTAKDTVVVKYYDAEGKQQELVFTGDSWRIDGNTVRINWKTQEDENLAVDQKRLAAEQKKLADEENLTDEEQKLADEEKLSDEERAALIEARTARLEALNALTDASFDLRIAGTFAKNAASVDFGKGAIALKVTPQPAEQPKETEQKDEQATVKEERPIEEKGEEQNPIKETNQTSQTVEENTGDDINNTDASKTPEVAKTENPENAVTSDESSQKSDDANAEESEERPTTKEVIKEITNEIPSLVKDIQKRNLIKLQTNTPASLDTQEGFEAMLLGAQADSGTSSSLRDFLIYAGISGTAVDGSVRPGQEYGIDLTFKENANLQFDTNATLTYQLPAGMTVIEDQTVPMTVNIVNNGVTYPVAAMLTVLKDGSLSITVDKSDSNFHLYEDATNVTMRASFKASFDGSKETIDFNDKVKKDVKIDTDDGARAYAEKDATFDEATGRFTYTVKVTASGNPKEVNVVDKITGNALKFNNDVHVSGNKSSYTTTQVSNGFNYTFAEMQDGEVITITYTADVDYSKDTDKNGEIAADQTANSVTVKPKDKPENSTAYSKQIVYTSINKSGEITAKDGNNVTQKWTITANQQELMNMAGQPLKDDIATDNTACTVTFAGTGPKIYVYDGQTLVGTVQRNWDDVTTSGSGTNAAHFEVNLPSASEVSGGDGKYRYVVEYETTTDADAALRNRR